VEKGPASHVLVSVRKTIIRDPRNRCLTIQRTDTIFQDTVQLKSKTFNDATPLIGRIHGSSNQGWKQKGPCLTSVEG